MARHGLDGLIGTTPENVQYLCALESGQFLLNRYKAQVFALVAAGRTDRPVVVTTVNDVSAVFQQCPPQTCAIYYGRFVRYVNPAVELTAHELLVKRHVVDDAGRNPPDAFNGLLAGLEAAGLIRGRVGYDERAFDHSHLPALTEKLPHLRLVPAWDIIREVRAVKTAEEVRRLSASVALTERGIQAAVAIAKTGCTEEDLAREFRTEVSRGGGYAIFEGITFSRRAAVGDLPIRDGILREGDLIRFDIGCKVDGYCSDIARLFAYKGGLDPRIHAIYAAMKAGEEAGMAIMKPGTTARMVFEETCRAVREAGVSDYRRTHVGHAIGLEMYEIPLLAETDDTPLEVGMVFEIETPYYELGLTGIQLEDTVVVQPDGVEMLTRSSRDIGHIG
jgi:Xaa-Pro aminopeptidase